MKDSIAWKTEADPVRGSFFAEFILLQYIVPKLSTLGKPRIAPEEIFRQQKSCFDLYLVYM